MPHGFHHVDLSDGPDRASPERGKLHEHYDLEKLHEKAISLSPEKIREKIIRINRKVQLASQGHEIEVVSDPGATTWASSKTPKLDVQKDGSLKEGKCYHYVIIVPFSHLAIDDDEFIAGEIRHELGHIRYSDWKKMHELREWVKGQGYPEELMSSLVNCLEDPRQEHVSTLPPHLEGYVKKWFWKKNRDLILPNIAKGLENAHPVTQFDFLIKLYGLWAIHGLEATTEGIPPWNGLPLLDPKVQEVWKKVKSTVDRIVGVGEHSRPEMLWAQVQHLIQTVMWPAKKELLVACGMPPETSPSLEPGHEGDGKSGTCSGHFEGESEDDHDDDNEAGGPKSTLKQLIEGYKKRKEKEGEEKAEQKKKIDEENKKIIGKQHERLEKLDGISSPEIRKQYQQFRKEAQVIEYSMKILFEKYFPKIAFPKDSYGIRGKKYNVREHLKRFGTGMEKPMGTPNIPEKSGFVLQLIVDVSGSMSGRRIEEVIKTVIGILEASKDYPIFIEVLASDDRHGGIDKQYILKAFHEEFSGATGGKVKTKLMQALIAFGGENNDAESLIWAVPRMVKKKRKIQADYDRVAALTIFFSDAAGEGQQDPLVVNELRKQVPILGGCIEPDPSIIEAVQKAYGPLGEGSFCPQSLSEFPSALERILHERILLLFRK